METLSMLIIAMIDAREAYLKAVDTDQDLAIQDQLEKEWYAAEQALNVWKPE